MSEMTVEQLQAAQAAEYGEYVADGPIVIGGVRAFNDGDPVPKSHVERGVVPKSQVKAAPKPAESDVETPAPAPAAPKSKDKASTA